MKITIAGTGYVGLVTAACMAEKGHNVICLDVDKNKIELLKAGKVPVYEDGLEELLIKNKDRLFFTSNSQMAYQSAEVIFIGVGTPEKKDGSANLAYVFEAAEQIAADAFRDCVVVVKSTVPIGANDKVEKILEENKKHDVKFHVASNPEFLSQGTAVHNTLNASRIVIGVEDAYAEQVLLEVYKEFNVPKLVMNRRSAEMVKYASNDFLALKISYINEIANLCEEVGADISDVSAGMGYDIRIGREFLKAGIGYGGSCFPKDTKALYWLSNLYDRELKTVKAAIEVNEQQKLRLIKKARRYYKSFEGLNIAVLGLTFKPGTDDLREAPSLVNIPVFLDEGANVSAWDPVGADNFRKLFPDEIRYCENVDEAIKDADICFILTEWPELKCYPTHKFAELMKRPLVLDGRNCLRDIDPAITYISIGK